MKIFVAVPCLGNPTLGNTTSMIAYASTKRFPSIIAYYQNYATHIARNMAVDAFLESDCDYLMFVDSDMGFGKEVIDDFAYTMEAKDIKVLGGVYQSRIARAPVMRKLSGERLVVMQTLPKENMFRADIMGTGMMMISRDILEAIAKPAFRYMMSTEFVELRKMAPTELGEDVSFCMRMIQMGVPIYASQEHEIFHYGQNSNSSYELIRD